MKNEGHDLRMLQPNKIWAAGSHELGTGQTDLVAVAAEAVSMRLRCLLSGRKYLIVNHAPVAHHAATVPSIIVVGDVEHVAARLAVHGVRLVALQPALQA